MRSSNPAYNVWKKMRARCRNPRDEHYKHYGARGIKVCPRWDCFSTFSSDMGPRPKGATIERIDNDQGYEPGNCRWATQAEQNANRSSARRLTLDGITMGLAAWAKKAGVEAGDLEKAPERRVAGSPSDLRQRGRESGRITA